MLDRVVADRSHLIGVVKLGTEKQAQKSAVCTTLTQIDLLRLNELTDC